MGRLKYPLESNPWLKNLKPLEYFPDVINDICFLLKKGINPAEPENYEWTFENLIGEHSGMPFYSEMGAFMRDRFINSIEYVNKNSCKQSLPFKIFNKYGYKHGGSEYMYIINPLTRRRVNVSGKIGKKVLNNYLKQLDLEND